MRLYTSIGRKRDCAVARPFNIDKNARFMETIADIRALPELGADSIHIWGMHVPGVLDRLEALHAVLSETEQEKAARFHFDRDRNTSIAARGTLRILLSGYTGIPAAEIEFQYSENGKPNLVPPASSRVPAGPDRQDACRTEKGRQGCLPHNMAFNLSHSGDWVVLAFGRGRNIGVDVEKIKWEMDVMSIAARYFAPEEIALIENAADRHTVFFQLWARKEAYVKACGSALFRELGSFAVPIIGNELPVVGTKDGWIFQRLDAGSQYAAAVVTNASLARVDCWKFGLLD